MSQPAGSRILRNAAVMTAANVFCKILQFTFFIVLIRQLDETIWGAFNTFGEAALILVVTSEMGVDNLLVRELSRRRMQPHPFVQHLFGLRLALIAAGLVILAGSLWIIRPPGQGLYIALACVYASLVGMLSFVRCVLRSYEAMGREAVLNLLDKGTTVALGIALVFAGYGVGGLLIAFCIGSVLALSLGTYWAWRICPGCVIPGRGNWKELLRIVWPFALVAICVALIHRQDTVMISALIDDAEAGRYNYAYRLLEGLFLLPQILSLAAYPAFSLMFHERTDLRARLFPLLRMLWLLAAPIVVGGILVGPAILVLIKPEAGDASNLLRVLLLAYPFVCGNFMVGTVLASVNRQHRNFVAGAVALAVNTVLNLATIPKYGAMGAAVATVVSQGIYCAIMFYQARDLFAGWSRETMFYVKTVLVALGMGAGVFWIGADGAARILLTMACGAALYAGLAALAGILRPRDLATVWRQVRNAGPMMRSEE